ncbi:hypothetical protein C8Q74DRAFT_976341 [Fomes fomentarius]|nr:hypothetical protein C8Q74DRAFT_976341 [Fomes fomentarius]
MTGALLADGTPCFGDSHHDASCGGNASPTTIINWTTPSPTLSPSSTSATSSPTTSNSSRSIDASSESASTTASLAPTLHASSSGVSIYTCIPAAPSASCSLTPSSTRLHTSAPLPHSSPSPTSTSATIAPSTSTMPHVTALTNGAIAGIAAAVGLIMLALVGSSTWYFVRSKYRKVPVHHRDREPQHARLEQERHVQPGVQRSEARFHALPVQGSDTQEQGRSEYDGVSDSRSLSEQDGQSQSFFIADRSVLGGD